MLEDVERFVEVHREYRNEQEGLKKLVQRYAEEEERQACSDVSSKSRLLYNVTKKGFKLYLHALKTTGGRVLQARIKSSVTFLFFMADEGKLQLAYANAFLEDVYDCLALDELQEFYDFFNSSLMRLKTVAQKADNVVVLKICNNMMKRLSKGTFHVLRGKVQQLLATLNSLHSKAGLNKKSAVNNTNIDEHVAEHSADASSAAASHPLQQLYATFWSSLPFLSNPFHGLDDMQQQVKKEKIMTFLRNMQPLLQYFKNNLIEEEEPPIKRYPKYIKDLQLFAFQINEPHFRKVLLLQLKFFLFNVDNPLKASGKSCEPLADSELKELKAFEELVSFLLKCFKPIESKPKRHMNEIAARVLAGEKDWMKWKDDGCNSFSKLLSDDDLLRFAPNAPLPDVQPLQSMLHERQKDIGSWLGIQDENYNHMLYLNKQLLSVRFFSSRRSPHTPSNHRFRAYSTISRSWKRHQQEVVATSNGTTKKT